MWAQYNIEKLKPLQDVRRFDDNHGNRFYYWMDNGEIKIASGTTTPFGRVSTDRSNIEKWKEIHPNWRQLLDVSSEYGTLEHSVNGDIMLNKGIDPIKLTQMQKLAYENGSNFDMPIKDILAFLKFHEDFELIPLVIEGVLIWKDPQTGEYLAMTIDLLSELNIITKTKETIRGGVYVRGDKKGQPKMIETTKEIKTKEIILLDFKGNFFEKDKKSFFETNKMQLIAAKLAVEQNFNLKVTRLYNFAPNNWRTTPSYTLFEQKITDKDMDKFYAYWKLIQIEELHKPEGKMLIPGDLKKSTDYRYVTYAEYVKDVLMKEELKLQQKDNVLSTLFEE